MEHLLAVFLILVAAILIGTVLSTTTHLELGLNLAVWTTTSYIPEADRADQACNGLPTGRGWEIEQRQIHMTNGYDRPRLVLISLY